jgi:hypothetical protein
VKVFLPSWNGDFRLEPAGEKSALILHEPTESERVVVGKFLHDAGKKEWTKEAVDKGQPYRGSSSVIQLDISLAKASKLLIKHARPKKQTLTAVKFSGGKMEITEGASSEALEKVEKDIAAAAKEEKPTQPAAAASVKRPTPCCPSCMRGAIKPATEVLLSFLDKDQHEMWRQRRSIIVEGGITGHRYLLAHRNSETGYKIGRICFDLDDGGVIHFHDWSIPPEEEVLAAMLVLEHREPWLRNQATCLGGNFQDVFDNPFGDAMDGVESANFAADFGTALMKVMSPSERRQIAREFSV